MLNSVKLPKDSYCTACWTGNYPLAIGNNNKGKDVLEERRVS